MRNILGMTGSSNVSSPRVSTNYATLYKVFRQVHGIAPPQCYELVWFMGHQRSGLRLYVRVCKRSAVAKGLCLRLIYQTLMRLLLIVTCCLLLLATRASAQISDSASSRDIRTEIRRMRGTGNLLPRLGGSLQGGGWLELGVCRHKQIGSVRNMTTGGPYAVADIKPSLNKPVVGAKVGYSYGILLLSGDISAGYYTDFHNSQLTITPSLGPSVLGLYSLLYGYNFRLLPDRMPAPGRHRISLSIVCGFEAERGRKSRVKAC